MEKRQMGRKKKSKIDRYTGLLIVMIIIFVSIISKLSYLQIAKAEDYKDKANQKGIREIPEFAPRGKILDNKGNILAKSENTYVLVYNEGEDTSEEFFSTMSKVFKILDENKESSKDDFQLKLKPFRFEFKAEDDNDKKALELIFKRDKGFNEESRRKLFPDKEKLEDEDLKKINEDILKLSAEDVFYKLVKQYELYKLLDTSDEFCKKMRDKKMTGKKITELLLKKYSLEEIRRYLIIKDTLKMQSFSGYKPVVVASDIKKETAFIFLQQLSDLPGIDVTLQPIRSYPYGEVGSAFLGYISKIDGGGKDKYEARGYDASTDYIGRAGLESAFEERLKGSKGGRIVKLNKEGRVIQELGRREAYPGQDMQLTINKDIQAVAEKALDDKLIQLQKNGKNYTDGVDTSNATRGAVAVIDVNTGGILALVSRPGFDPNLFAKPSILDSDKEMYNKLFNPDLIAMGQEYIARRGLDTNKISLDTMFPIDVNGSTKKKVIRRDNLDIFPKPMFNYATMGMTPPGSTFKPLTAIAGLEEGVITKSFTVNDSGPYTNFNFGGRCWSTSGHGPISVVKAIQDSCNYFFYDVGDKLMGQVGDVNKNTLAKYAWKFGLGYDPNGSAKRATGIEIYESFGNVSNLESLRISNATSGMFQLKGSLKKLKVGSDGKEIGIDLDIHEEDSEEVRQLKSKICDECKEQMMYKKDKTYSAFTAKQRENLTQLVKLTPDIKDKITKGDIGVASTRIFEKVRDTYTQITTPCNIYNAAIGQGESRFTPLQLANYMATVVNGGKRYKLHLVDKFLDPNGTVIQQIKPEIIEDVKLKPETVATVIEGMEKVTEDGTASSTFSGFPIPNGGKTGSATYNENQSIFGREAFGVYVGFAPLNNPRIAVCVVVYDGAHGGLVADVAKSVYETYFKDEILAQQPGYQFMYPVN